MAERKARRDLERMLVDETAEPRALPLSLLENITGDFSHAHEIGRGGFAVVYKGILGNRAVAVKRMSNAFMDEMEFHREIECLMRVKHKNVVRFLGYCANRQGTMETYGNKLVMADVHQRLLCFEYIPHESLDKYIIDARREWGTCYRIIKGICEGLQYLHENNIIHLDLKPANILLGNNMVPKITDFGLSRCFEENQSRHITKNIKGTVGYLAPERRDGGVIARSADLYSLGVIIIEILTGQKSYQDIGDVLEIWSGRLERSRQDTLCEQIRVCYEIALECVDFSPTKRPASARNIIDRLHEMRSVQLDDLQAVGIPHPVEELSIHSVQLLPSREDTLKNALRCIKEDVAVGMIGIWGPDRDEKTHLLKKINDSFLGECPFDFVIFVTASSELSVQAQIISRLRTDTVPDVATQATRISELLKKKSFLLLVDDLRVQLDLQAVGIPHPLGDVEAGEVSRWVQRKVVVTSISQSICHLMDVERYIQVPDLEEHEARQLFAEEYGQQDPYSDPGIGALAEQLVRELKGLPSDLIHYGKVMQGIRDVRRWEDAIDAVRKANLQRDDPLNLAEKIVRNLENATEDLDAKGKDVRREIVDVERQQRTPTNEVNRWLQKVDNIIRDVQVISHDCRQLKKDVTMEASEKLHGVQECLSSCPSTVAIESMPPPVQEMPGPSMSAENRNLQDALHFIKDEPTVGMIGIWGPGGVGKTHLLNTSSQQ